MVMVGALIGNCRQPWRMASPQVFEVWMVMVGALMSNCRQP